MYAQAQTPVVFEEWAESKGVQEFFYKNVTVTDVSNNVYVAGATLNGAGNYDLLISKFDRHGVHIWSDTIAGAGGGHDMAAAIAIDAEGDLLVCGTISAGGSEGNNMLLVKYDTDGFEYWRYSHDNAGNDEAAVALCIDSNNDVYLTGATYNSTSLSDMLTIKVDSYGDLVWDETYDYNSLYDLGVKIALSGSRVVVTGGGQYNFNSFVIIALSYMQSDGSLSGSATSGGTQQTMEEVSDLYVDENDNIYISGSVINSGYGYDFKIIKLDEDLNVLWTQTWDGQGLNDYSRGVKVAPNGDVYVCGTTATTDDGDDMVLLKYSSGGNLYWAETYNGNYRGDDRAETLEYHPDGFIYIAGSSFVVSNMDYLTLKYNTSGDLLWEINYNSPHNKNDRATNMAIDSDGDIIVTGQCERDSVLKTYYAVKYVERNIMEYSFEDSNHNAQTEFIKNVGQVLTNENTFASDIAYYSTSLKQLSFFKNNGWSMVDYTRYRDSLTTDTIVKLNIDFVQPQSSCKVYGNNQLTNFSNHYGNIVGTRERVLHFEDLIYPNIWDKIDLVFAGDEIHITTLPTSKLSDIKFDISGASQVQIDSLGKVILHTSIRTFVIPAPRVYQYSSSVLEELNWSPEWSYNQGELSLTSIGVYEENEPLIFRLHSVLCPESNIEQNELLCYSSYFGGDGDDFIKSILTSDSNDRIICGYTTNYFLYPLPTVLVEFSSINGGQIFVTRFSDTFEPEFTSIIYGEGNQWNSAETYLRSATYSNGGIFSCGTTWSHLPPIGPQVVSPNMASSNAFVFKLQVADGALDWLTYFGGAGEDGANDIAIDSDGKIYVVGFCENINNTFPLISLNGAFNSNISGTSGFISRFNQNFVLEWSTTFGGSEDDILNCITIFPDNSIAVAGITESEDLFMDVVNGTDQFSTLSDNEGNYFLARFLNSGEYSWSTYIPGKVKFHIYRTFKGIDSDGSHSIYFGAGLADASSFQYEEPTTGYFHDSPIPWPGSIGTYSNQYSFLMKFNANLNLIWSTLIGEGGLVSNISSIKYQNGKLYVGSTIQSENPLLLEIAPYYFNESIPTYTVGPTIESTDAMITIFSTYNNELLYSTLLGGFEFGSHEKDVSGFLVLNDEDFVIAGNTRSSYNCINEYQRQGIPVHLGYSTNYFLANNPDDNNWNNANRSGYISHFCFPFGSPLSVEENVISLNDVLIFPNPTTVGNLTFSSVDNMLIETIQVYASDGRLAYSRQPNLNTIFLDVNNWSKGIYIAVIQVDGYLVSKKFVVN